MLIIKRKKHFIWKAEWSLSLLASYPNACNSQNCARLKQWTVHFVWISYGDSGPQVFELSQLPPRVYISRNLESRVDPGPECRHSAMECRHPKWRLDCCSKCLSQEKCLTASEGYDFLKAICIVRNHTYIENMCTVQWIITGYTPTSTTECATAITTSWPLQFCHLSMPPQIPPDSGIQVCPVFKTGSLK